jgi:hypothetical protein
LRGGSFFGWGFVKGWRARSDGSEVEGGETEVLGGAVGLQVEVVVVWIDEARVGDQGMGIEAEFLP